MTKQKARGGKKQRYSIADIGGGDLTSQDVSTEKVLNFLIRGGLPEAERHDAVGGDDAVAAPGQEAFHPDETSLPSRENDTGTAATGGSATRRSLDHLFNRGNKGVAVKATATAEEVVVVTAAETVVTEVITSPPPAEEDSLPPSTINGNALSVLPESLYDSSPTGGAETHETPAPLPDVDIEAGNLSAKNPEAQFSAFSASADSASPERPSSPADHYEAELTRQIERWKGFYRLKDGEVSALSTLFRLSHAAGSSECYVKMHKLAEASNLTYRYCQKVIRSLEQLGWIVKLKDYDASTQMGVLYRVNLKPTE